MKDFVAKKGCKTCLFGSPYGFNAVGVFCDLIQDDVSLDDYDDCPLDDNLKFRKCFVCTWFSSGCRCRCSYGKPFIASDGFTCPLGKWDK